MKLEVLRISSESDSSSGLVFDVTNGRKFLCYSLEDEYRSEKVMHETRVPAGTYKILLRKEGYMMLIKLLFLIKKSRKAEIPENSMITILFIEARR